MIIYVVLLIIKWGKLEIIGVVAVIEGN